MGGAHHTPQRKAHCERQQRTHTIIEKKYVCSVENICRGRGTGSAHRAYHISHSQYNAGRAPLKKILPATQQRQNELVGRSLVPGGVWRGQIHDKTEA